MHTEPGVSFYDVVLRRGATIPGSRRERTMPYITLDTYPRMFIDYDKKIENPNYDHEVRLFTVPYRWLSEEMTDITLDLDYWLLNEYDWDQTLALYGAAKHDGVIVDERVIRR